MDVNTSVRLTDDEEQQLTQIMSPTALADALTNLGRAALREYVEMLLGQSGIRSPEMREQRLLLLILDAYGGSVPDEAKVAKLFNLTPSGARSLTRTVLSRYRLRLADPIRRAAIDVLRGCAAEAGGFRRVSIRNPAIVEHLNALLAELNGELKRIAAESRTGTCYRIPEDSYVALAGELHL